MLKVGITGGIGSGKSIVSRLFRALGVPFYDADSRARSLMETDPRLRAELQAAFGADTYDAAGRLDRGRLAGLVFNQPARLAQLNALVHPRVGLDFAAWTEAQRAGGHAYVLKEAALMFESGAHQQLDCVLTVFAPLAVRLARVLRRDPHRTPADVRAIMDKQLAEDEKVARAHYVIYNDDAQLVIPQVLALHARLAAGRIGD